MITCQGTTQPENRTSTFRYRPSASASAPASARAHTRPDMPAV